MAFVFSNIIYNNEKIPDKWKNEIGYREFMIKLVNSNDTLFNYLSIVNQSHTPQQKVDSKRSISQKPKKIIHLRNASTEKNKKEDFYQTGLGMSFPTQEMQDMKDELQKDKSKTLKRNRSTLLPPITKKSEDANITYEAGKKYSMLIKPPKNGLSLSQSQNVEFNVEGFLKNVDSGREGSAGSRVTKSPSPIRKTKIKRIKHKTQTQTVLLNAVAINKKEIINPTVKKMLKEVNGFGPRCPHCDSCNNLNVDYYNKMKSNKAIDLLKFIKDKRVKMTNFKDCPHIDFSQD